MYQQLIIIGENNGNKNLQRVAAGSHDNCKLILNSPLDVASESMTTEDNLKENKSTADSSSSNTVSSNTATYTGGSQVSEVNYQYLCSQSQQERLAKCGTLPHPQQLKLKIQWI